MSHEPGDGLGFLKRAWWIADWRMVKVCSYGFFSERYGFRCLLILVAVGFWHKPTSAPLHRKMVMFPQQWGDFLSHFRSTSWPRCWWRSASSIWSWQYLGWSLKFSPGSLFECQPLVLTCFNHQQEMVTFHNDPKWSKTRNCIRYGNVTTPGFITGWFWAAASRSLSTMSPSRKTSGSKKNWERVPKWRNVHWRRLA